MFGIVSAEDFRAKAARDCDKLLQDVANPDLAMNAILSNYHLHEWVWSLDLKAKKPVTIDGVVFRSAKDWVGWLDDHCPHFQLLQALATGTKHCVPTMFGTGQVEGYGAGPYGIGPFGKPYLLIDLGADLPGDVRWLVGSEVLKEVSSFWAEFFAKHL